MTTEERYEEVVAEAATWLDQNWNAEEFGGPWYDAVDLGRVDMGHPCTCVAGQLGYRIAERYGMQSDEGRYRINIRGGFNAIGGYDLLVTAGLFPTWKVREQEDMQELLRFASKVVGGDGTLPPTLRCAFSTGTPLACWRREIERRREQ